MGKQPLEEFDSQCRRHIPTVTRALEGLGGCASRKKIEDFLTANGTLLSHEIVSRTIVLMSRAGLVTMVDAPRRRVVWKLR